MHTYMVAFEFLFQYRVCCCLHVVLWCVYTPSSPTIPPPPPLPPVLSVSVPTIPKGRVSTTSLQRSRSDVDVNAAAVAKHRYVGQTRAAGHLPPGSCSSLGKGETNDLWDADISQYGISSSSAQTALCSSSFWHFVNIPVKTLKMKLQYTIGTPQWWGWPFCLLLLSPLSFSLHPPSAIRVKMSAWTSLYMPVLLANLILHVDWSVMLSN